MIDPRPGLARWASDPARSRGRRFPASPAPLRNAFQRDRDRIVHSTAFRRLVYKTQVFVNSEGDLFRTRLTHSLEVAQVARSIARPLNLHEDLVEAICLAHDLGHTPFGHAGQDALNTCMAGFGGFEHNWQSLRVVDLLEHRYPDHDGLNLCFETREGILKHCSPKNARQLEAAEPGGPANRFLAGTQPGLEAQLANLADAIAYNAHDIDDGVRSGLLKLEALHSIPLIGRHLQTIAAQHPHLAEQRSRRLLYGAIRSMLAEQIHDVIRASDKAIEAAGVKHADDVRRLPRPLITFSPAMQTESTQLKRFLFKQLYRHPKVMATNDQGRQVIRELFEIFLKQPQELRASFRRQSDQERAVADYIAGMTDRFALSEHARLSGRPILIQAQHD